MSTETPCWRMFAHRCGGHNGTYLAHLGERRWVEIHGLEEPIVPVQVREVEHDDPAGTHWGWLGTGKDTPTMIWPSRVQFNMCFPYGPAVEAEHGKGRILRLAVTEVTE